DVPQMREATGGAAGAAQHLAVQDEARRYPAAEIEERQVPRVARGSPDLPDRRGRAVLLDDDGQCQSLFELVPQSHRTPAGQQGRAANGAAFDIERPGGRDADGGEPIPADARLLGQPVDLVDDEVEDVPRPRGGPSRDGEAVDAVPGEVVQDEAEACRIDVQTDRVAAVGRDLVDDAGRAHA